MDPQIFDGCSNLKEVVLPDGLATIAGREFAECSSLQKINLPKSLLTIGGYAFTGCKQLKNIAIPESVKDIGEGAFYECTGLESIVIPDSVTSIGVQAFRGCSSLKQAELSDNIKIIPAGMFWNCSSLTEIDIPDGVVSIGDSKWEECAFDGCTGLQKVTIPDSVKYINEDEFMDSETLKIYYGSFKSYVAEWVKENAPYKDAYRTPDPDPQLTPTPDPQPTPTPDPQPTPTPDQKSSETTDTQQDKNQKVPATKGTILTVTKYQCKVRVTSATLPTVEYLATTNKKATTIKVPDSVTVDDITYKVTTVAAKALSGNRKVKKVILGKNVTAIGKNAFAKCKNLKKIEVKSVKWSKKSVGKDAFKGTNKKLVIKVPKKKASVYKKYVRGKGNKTIRVK